MENKSKIIRKRWCNPIWASWKCQHFQKVLLWTSYRPSEKLLVAAKKFNSRATKNYYVDTFNNKNEFQLFNAFKDVEKIPSCLNANKAARM